jgi:hypothetical protein
MPTGFDKLSPQTSGVSMYRVARYLLITRRCGLVARHIECSPSTPSQN